MRNGAGESGNSLQPGAVGRDELPGLIESPGGFAQLAEIVIDLGAETGA